MKLEQKIMFEIPWLDVEVADVVAMMRAML